MGSSWRSKPAPSPGYWSLAWRSLASLSISVFSSARAIWHPPTALPNPRARSMPRSPWFARAGAADYGSELSCPIRVLLLAGDKIVPLGKDRLAELDEWAYGIAKTFAPKTEDGRTH